MKTIGLLVVLMLLMACKKDKVEVVEDDIDGHLLDIAKNTSGYVWYKNSDTLLPRSDGSGHSQAFLRTRFNPTAAAMLDSVGKVMEGITFPNGSVIIKELYTDANTFDRWAILLKDSGSEFADSQGWVWGYINADESVAVSAKTKGTSCITCHSQAGSIDRTLMNAYFP